MVEYKRNHKDELKLSLYIDDELSSPKQEQVETLIAQSPQMQKYLQRIQAVSTLVKDHNKVYLSPEEQSAFDLALAKRLQSEPTRASLLDWICTPFRMIWNLSWQWQTALVMTILLMAYIPILMQNTSQEPGTSLILDTDYSNSQFFYDRNPEKKYDMIWLLTDDEEPLPKEEKEKKESPVGFHTIHRA